MADKLFIKGLLVDCIIGRADWERMVRQTVRIDMVMACDVRAASRHDEVVDGTPNTKAICKRTIAYVQETSFQLIETLAENLARVLITEFGLRRLRLRVSKPGALRGAQDVGVHIVRGPGDYQ